MGSASNLNLKRGKEKKNEILSPIFGSGCELERERRETPHSLNDIWKLGGRSPSSQDLKFIYSKGGYAWVPTTSNFFEDFVFGEEKLERETLTSL